MNDTVHGQSGTDWDVIVIGSGIGGMAAGAALAKTGHRVLLLEQYQTLGGLTHSFSRNGFSWDVGIHYLGGLAPGEPEKEILDWISETPIELESMGAVFDTVHLGTAEPLQLSRPFEAYELDLKEQFPEEADAISKWVEALRQGRDTLMTVFQCRAMPGPVAAGLKWWKQRAIKKWCGRTTEEVARSLTRNEDLIAAFTAQWGDFGGRPSTASFAVHATVIGSFLECGAWYPVGGASVIADHILPTITAAGGEVHAGVKVETLLMEEDRVVGVLTEDGDELKADKVISAIGARETVEFLLPDDCGQEVWKNDIRSIGSNIAHFSLFLGFEGDVEAAGATRSNHWMYPSGNVDVLWENAPKGKPPGMFVSFASLKDPAHDPGPNKQHVGEVLALTDWSVVERWANSSPGSRGDDYAIFKRRVEEAMFHQFQEYFPELAELTVYRELATPLSTVAITGHFEGAFYGLDVTPARVLSDALRMKTPLKGLYLAGQDSGSPGIAGALWSGLLAAATVDPKVFTHFPRGNE